MGRSSYRPEEDQYRDYRCTCLHLSTAHDNDGRGACDWCRCGEFIPVMEKAS